MIGSVPFSIASSKASFEIGVMPPTRLNSTAPRWRQPLRPQYLGESDVAHPSTFRLQTQILAGVRITATRTSVAGWAVPYDVSKLRGETLAYAGSL
jgi:hypothetical protein